MDKNATLSYIAIILLILMFTCTDILKSTPEPFAKINSPTNISVMTALNDLKQYQQHQKDPNSNFNIVTGQRYKEQEDKYPSYEHAFPENVTGYFDSLCNKGYTKRYMYNAVPPTKNGNIGIRKDPVPAKKPQYDTTGIFWQSTVDTNYTDQRDCKGY